MKGLARVIEAAANSDITLDEAKGGSEFILVHQKTILDAERRARPTLQAHWKASVRSPTTQKKRVNLGGHHQCVPIKIARTIQKWNLG
jgi:hypothetical protein